tara:strand:+ start:1120 stop:1680 length:561 start_codon:yes stop_codon:yes gene_type:complete
LEEKDLNKKDNNLIDFCNGNTNTTETLYKRWSPEFYFISYKYLKNKEDAEDIVADTFEKLLNMPLKKRKQKFIEDGIDLKALLIVVVKNKSLDKIKQKNNRRRILVNIKHLIPTTTKNKVWHHFSDDLVESMLLILPEREQQMFKMTLEGYNRKEIANALNLSLKTVSNSLSSSRSKLKDSIDYFY